MQPIYQFPTFDARHKKYESMLGRFKLITFGFAISTLIVGVVLTGYFRSPIPLFVSGSIVMGWAQVAGY